MAKLSGRARRGTQTHSEKEQNVDTEVVTALGYLMGGLGLLLSGVGVLWFVTVYKEINEKE
jgi:hypothetical protein